MKNVRLDTVLRKLLARLPVESGAVWTLREDRIEITTHQAQVAEIWGEYNGPFLPLVWATFDKVPLEDALKELAEQTDFTIVLDNRAGEKGRTPVTARLRNTPLDTALRLLADMADLRPVHTDNVLYVTTKENAAAMEARLERERKTGEPAEEPKAPRKGSGPGAPAKPKGAAAATAG
jgi:type II secretory pathway component HofQ